MKDVNEKRDRQEICSMIFSRFASGFVVDKPMKVP